MSGCYAVFHKQLGDLVLLEPALHRLREQHGEPVVVLTRNGHAPVVELMTGVETRRGWPVQWRSHLYCFDPLNKSAVRSLFAPATRKRCILPDREEMQWFHRPLFGDVIVPGLGDRYVAEYFWDLVPVPAKSAFRGPRLNAPPDSWRPNEVGEQPFILLNATSGWKRKNWLPERWAEVIRAVHGMTGWPVVATSASTDWQIEHTREIEKGAAVGSGLRSLASGTSLENYLWLCSRAQMVLTVDGAAAHLAAAFGVKNLTLFGPTNIHNWHHPSAISRAIQAETSKDGKVRLRSIEAGTVIQAAGELLDGTV